MATPNVDEAAPLIPNDGIPTVVRNTRRSYEKQLAMYFILASILFQTCAFDLFDANLENSLQFNRTLNWTFENSLLGANVFRGK
jgi:hypothetical protein